MTDERDDRASAGQLEPCTEFKCEQCGMPFVPKNRNGVKARFCKPDCSVAWHNAQRLKGAALLKGKHPLRKRAPVRLLRKPRTLDELSAAEGLPPGCYSAGALARVAGRKAGQDTLADLLAAARRVGLTADSPQVTAARAAKAQEITG